MHPGRPRFHAAKNFLPMSTHPTPLNSSESESPDVPVQEEAPRFRMRKSHQSDISSLVREADEHLQRRDRESSTAPEPVSDPSRHEKPARVLDVTQAHTRPPISFQDSTPTQRPRKFDSGFRGRSRHQTPWALRQSWPLISYIFAIVAGLATYIALKPSQSAYPEEPPPVLQITHRAGKYLPDGSYIPPQRRESPGQIDREAQLENYHAEVLAFERQERKALWISLGVCTALVAPILLVNARLSASSRKKANRD